ncbi:hypothetical protein EVAR_39877_1 [Eumeta japonica]|uniref:Uncharacterized protein n=1 Tax=Eumeta variegata TaxID=151549 RepID=A0A4C1WRY7_EUMVA|nr:hypothetical protein EVAR_39877_1 [Eumeta japonica]
MSGPGDWTEGDRSRRLEQPEPLDGCINSTAIYRWRICLFVRGSSTTFFFGRRCGMEDLFVASCLGFFSLGMRATCARYANSRSYRNGHRGSRPLIDTLRQGTILYASHMHITMILYL